MKTTRLFAEGDRYLYDFGPCSYTNGFAQLDTAQDASYFGTWVSPGSLKLVNYCEGDITIHEAESAAELAAHIAELARWNIRQGYKAIRIDPGLDPAMRQALIDIGLREYLH